MGRIEVPGQPRKKVCKAHLSGKKQGMVVAHLSFPVMAEV
jgi:hypothetical protein